MTTVADAHADSPAREAVGPATGSVAAELRAAGCAEATADPTVLAAYSSDGSLFRLRPQAVAFPRSDAEVAAALQTARRLGVGLVCRGAGTSLAGNAVGTGIILDFSRHLNRILELLPAERAVWVEPGVVHAQLQAAAKPHGLRFGPDPSTNSRCTIGGMIGNNACGPRAMGYGRTVDNIEALDVMLADGTVVRLDGQDDARHFPRLHALVARSLEPIRTEVGTFSRQVSGYGLDWLLPEHSFDLRRAFAGSEGTWGIVLRARMRLVAEPAHLATAVLGYPDMAAAADDVPALRAFPVTACEGLERRMLDRLIEAKGRAAVPDMPEGGGWMVIELAGDSAEELQASARDLVAASHAQDSMVFGGGDPTAAAIWKIRADGAGLVSRTPDGRDAHAGWEDSAVPPEHLGDYIRALMELLDRHGLWALPYGHFGDGCLHMRVDFPLDEDGGRQAMRDFMFDAARLVARFGGSVSGEHGDGRARGELLPRIFSPAVIELFAQVKALFDPRDTLNPGIIVAPDALDEDIRTAQVRPGDMPAGKTGLAFALAGDGGDFATAVHRCTGVGKCRADSAAGGGVMCPSYQATRNEVDSTRGRARVLQEMVRGEDVHRDWRAPEVHEALDLCLSCKACGSECPTGTDMATYKAEVLYQAYRGRLRPADHYLLGWLPVLSRAAAPLAPLVNLVGRVPALAAVAKRAGRIDGRRAIPAFTRRTFTRWFRHAGAAPAGRERRRQREVVLFADSWSNFFAPRVLAAAVAVLRDAGVDVRVLPSTECCGLSLISTGQLDGAKRLLGSAVEALDATDAAGEAVPIIGVEPSCTAVLREDAVALLGTDAARRVAERTKTLAEYLLEIGYRPQDLTGVRAVVQPHCHQSAVMGFAADEELLDRAGVERTVLGGCCGLAGNFGVVEGHYEVSEAVGELALLPAVRAAAPDTVVLADGYSCRTQLHDLSDRRGVHLAELLAWGLEAP